MTRRQLFRQYTEKLCALYDKVEAESLAGLALRHAGRFDNLQWHLSFDGEPEIEELKKAEEILERLLRGEPFQYISGEAWFYGLRFSVNFSVLIPRPETEMLTDLIIRENEKIWEPVIADIGTGSGCIAVTLAKFISGSCVYAFDISDEVLQLAQRNAQENKVKIHFKKIDILSENLSKFLPNADIIVSNPPYVLQSDKPAMLPNVLEYEPHLALFVPDDNALLFYKAIAEKAWPVLTIGGRLYFEIHETKSGEIAAILSQLGFSGIEVFDDFNNKNRFVTAVK